MLDPRGKRKPESPKPVGSAAPSALIHSSSAGLSADIQARCGFKTVQRQSMVLIHLSDKLCELIFLLTAKLMGFLTES